MWSQLLKEEKFGTTSYNGEGYISQLSARHKLLKPKSHGKWREKHHILLQVHNQPCHISEPKLAHVGWGWRWMHLLPLETLWWRHHWLSCHLSTRSEICHCSTANWRGWRSRHWSTWRHRPWTIGHGRWWRWRHRTRNRGRTSWREALGRRWWRCLRWRWQRSRWGTRSWITIGCWSRWFIWLWWFWLEVQLQLCDWPGLVTDLPKSYNTKQYEWQIGQTSQNHM